MKGEQPSHRPSEKPLQRRIVLSCFCKFDARFAAFARSLLQRLEPDPAKLAVLNPGLDEKLRASVYNSGNSGSGFTKTKMTNGLLEPYYPTAIDELLTLHAKIPPFALKSAHPSRHLPPTLKDAFRLWVFELVMSRPGAPRRRKHQHKLKRNYQFPNCVWFEHNDENKVTCWVTNVVGNKPIYGVVRYFVDGDQRAWVESDTFDQDKDTAIRWCREKMKALAEEQSK